MLEQGGAARVGREIIFVDGEAAGLGIGDDDPAAGIADEADMVDDAVVADVAAGVDQPQLAGRRVAIIDPGPPLAIVDADPHHPLRVGEPAPDAVAARLDLDRGAGGKIDALDARRGRERGLGREQDVAAGRIDEDHARR